MNSFNKLTSAPELVTFGETMASFMPDGERGIEYSSRFEKMFGGAESNVAIGVARLGGSAGWFGHLGDDPFGRVIMKTLRGEGVDVSRAKLRSDAPTGLMLRETVAGKSSVYYYRKLSAASRMEPSDLDEHYIAAAKILHVTGITPALSASCLSAVKHAVAVAKRNGVTVCFDPNLRLKLWSAEEARATLLELAAEADYFLPGLDELKMLYGTDQLESLIDRLNNLRAVCVIKGGENLTYLLERGELQEVPYFKAERVVDTVGAGDGFCAGFITGLLRGWTHLEAVRFGNLIGSMVVQLPGDWEAVPTFEQAFAVMQGRQQIER